MRTAIDRTRWAIHSNAEADRCLGNKGNQQLEWRTWDALSVRDGILTMTARKNNPEPGYEWSSALITTGQACGHEPPGSFAVKPGDSVETRLKLPSAKGFWPSTWTWNGNGSNEGHLRVLQRQPPQPVPGRRRQLHLPVPDRPDHRLAHDRPAARSRRDRLVPGRQGDLPPGRVLGHRRTP